MPDAHPPTPPPSRWPALITLPTLTKFQLGWRRLCDVALFPSCLINTAFPMPCIIRVSFASRSSCTLYSSSSFEGPTLSSFLHPDSLPPSFPSSLLLLFLRPLCLASPFLPCLTSSALPRFLPPSLPSLRPSSISPPSRWLGSSCKASSGYALVI